MSQRGRTAAKHGGAWHMVICVLLLAAAGGCTRESLRIAIETQRRTDEVQQTIHEQQQEALRLLLYRELIHRLEQPGLPLTEAQRAAVNEAWNQRDLLEFWAVQQERARALRLVGVDAKLASDQSIVDLLIKQAEARADRVKQRLAERAGSAALSNPAPLDPGGTSDAP